MSSQKAAKNAKASVGSQYAQALEDFLGQTPRSKRSRDGTVTHTWRGINRELKVKDGKGWMFIGELEIKEKGLE